MLRTGKDLVYQFSPRFVRRHVIGRLTVPKSPFTAETLEHQVIFIHVPKAAGTSVKTEIYGKATGGHRSIAEFMTADPDRTDLFFKFSFVRNPWDRMVSAYSFLSQGEGGTTPAGRDFARKHLGATPTFDTFARRLADPEFRSAVMGWPHFRPQTDWICLPGEESPHLDCLGRFERMDADLAALRSRLANRAGSSASSDGANPATRDRDVRTAARQVTPHRRPSRHVPYQDLYTSTTRSIIEELYARDIRVLSYAFDGAMSTDSPDS